MTSIHRTQHVSSFRGAIQHSTPSRVGLYWSPGQGVRPPPGSPPAHMWGLYVNASVKSGHHLQLDGVKLSKATKTLTLTVDSRGIGAPGKTNKKEELYVRNGFSLQAEKWTVVVKDGKGHQLLKKQLMLGGPPAA